MQVELDKQDGFSNSNQDHLVFKYKSIDANTLSSLQTGEVWFANRELLNDPYDCRPDICWDLTNDQIIELFLKLGYEVVVESKIEVIKGLLEDSFHRLIDRSGVFCVTEKPLNELMWAHYADSHRGITIGYKVKAENMNNRAHAYRATRAVGYEARGFARMSDYYAYVDKKCDAAFERLIKAFYFSKTKVWQYEQEHRFLSINSNGLKDIDAPIDAIYFGANTPQAHKDLVCSLVNETVTLFQVCLGKQELIAKPYKPVPDGYNQDMAHARKVLPKGDQA